MALFGKPKTGVRTKLHDVQFSTIKDTLRKKNKEKAKAEAVVMEW